MNPAPLSWPKLIVLVAAGAALLAAAAATRPADGDEGLYQYAALRLGEGSLPYRDFVYPQMPYLLLPYSLAGRSFALARGFSVVFGASALLLLGLILRPRGAAAAGGILLLACSATFLVWVSTVKSYPLTLALSLLAFWLVQARTPARSFGAGLVLGALIGTRLLYAPLPLVFLAWIAAQGDGRRRHALLLAAGTALALLPVAVVALLAPARFWFDVVGHHAIRSAAGAVGNADQKWEVVGRIVMRPQWAILLVLAAAGAARRLDGPALLAAGAGAALALMSLLPTPSYEQYFVCIVPFVILVLAPTLEAPAGPRAWAAAALLFGLYAAGAPAEYEHQQGGEPPHELAELRAVAGAIRSHAAPGEEIVSFWAGYAVLSGTRLPPGLDNCCAYRYGLERMTPESRRAHGLPGEEEVGDWIRARRYRVVQVGGYAQTSEERGRLRALLAASGYRPVHDRLGVSVHVRD